MKIGIITICKVNNYGAELQAFATCKKLEQLGYDAEIIDYTYYKDWRYKDSRRSKPLLPMNRKEMFVYWMKYRFINCLVDTVFPIFSAAIRKRKVNYNAFIRKGRFSRPYRSMDDLYEYCKPYDAYMVGSDQVWNPAASSSIEPYFLTFAPPSARKVAYASSFGVTEMELPLQTKLGNWLRGIDFIAVRESSGVDLVRRLAGREAQVVVDPTLLLSKSEWADFMKPYPGITPHYVLIYQLSESKAIANLALRIGQAHQIPVFRICKRAFGIRRQTGITDIPDAGPEEFLSLIGNADYVVTNSFHGTAFSVNLNVPFYVIVSSWKKNNSRMESLLDMTGLRHRMFGDDVDINAIPIEPVRFEQSMEALGKQRELSIRYLIDSLR